MTQTSTHAWSISRAAQTCRACNTALNPGDPCWAALVEGLPPDPATPDAKPQPYTRLDYCDACWSAGKRPPTQTDSPTVATPITLLSFWKSTVPVPNQKKKLFVDDSVLQDLFTRLAEKTDPQDIRFRFVLALILMRKRLLRYDSTLPDTTPETWLMTPRGAWHGRPAHDPLYDQNPVKVINPNLTPDQIAEVSTQLSTILAEEI